MADENCTYARTHAEWDDVPGEKYMGMFKNMEPFLLE